MEALSLSVHPNYTHPYIELNHELNHEHNQLLGGSTLLHGGGDPYPTHTQHLQIFKFCVIDALPVHLFNNLVTLFDANAHKINNTTALVVWWTKMQNKHQLPTNGVQCTLLTKHCEIERN